MFPNEARSVVQGIDNSKVKPAQGFLVIADISGYTRFVLAHKQLEEEGRATRLGRVNQEHAEAIITMLLETVIEGLEGTLILNKLEGDAALFYAVSDDPSNLAARLLPRLMEVFERFNARLEGLWECNGCFCNACCERGNLRIKVLAHCGEFMLKRVSRFEELAGEAVILVHRLLKNEVDSHEYLLVTDALGALLPETQEWELRDEQVEDFGTQPVRVLYPAEPQVKMRGLRPPWPWEYIAMHKLFKSAAGRASLEQRVSQAVAASAQAGATPESLLQSR